MRRALGKLNLATTKIMRRTWAPMNPPFFKGCYRQDPSFPRTPSRQDPIPRTPQQQPITQKMMLSTTKKRVMMNTGKRRVRGNGNRMKWTCHPHPRLSLLLVVSLQARQALDWMGNQFFGVMLALQESVGPNT
jgi:hypothetical protein